MTKAVKRKKKANIGAKSNVAKQKIKERQRQFMDESLSQAGKFQLKSGNEFSTKNQGFTALNHIRYVLHFTLHIVFLVNTEQYYKYTYVLCI